MLLLESSPTEFSEAELELAVREYLSGLPDYSRLQFAAFGPDPKIAQPEWWEITHAASDASDAETKKVVRGAIGVLGKAPKAKIQAAIEAGDIAGAVSMFPWKDFEQSLFRGFDKVFKKIATRSGADTAIQIGRGIDFDEGSVAAFFTRGARVASTRILKSTRRAVTLAMRRLMSGGLLSAFQMRTQIFILAGLDPLQMNAAINLLVGLKTANKTVAQLKKASELLAKTKIAARAELIARFENLNVAQAAQEEAVQQQIDVGVLKNVVKIWVVTPDERVCPICNRLNKQRRLKEQAFVDPFTQLEYIGPPAHQRCRCGLRYVQARKKAPGTPGPGVQSVGVFVVDIRVPDSVTAARESHQPVTAR